MEVCFLQSRSSTPSNSIDAKSDHEFQLFSGRGHRASHQARGGSGFMLFRRQGNGDNDDKTEDSYNREDVS